METDDKYTGNHLIHWFNSEKSKIKNNKTHRPPRAVVFFLMLPSPPTPTFILEWYNTPL